MPSTHSRLHFSLRALFPAATFGALLLPTGCMTGDDDKGGDLLSQYEQALTDHNPTTRTFTTKVSDWECDENGVAKETIENVENEYLIDGGKLYVWIKGECEAVAMTGSSTELYGTWTLEDFEDVLIPASARPEDCPDVLEEDPYEDENIFEGVKAVYDITPNGITAKLEGEMCMGRYMASSFLGAEGDEEDPTNPWEVVSSSCTNVSLRNKETQKTANITSNMSGDEVSLKFTFDGTTCSMKMPVDVPGQAIDCSEDGGFDQEFATCLFESGFYGDFNFEGLEKSAANSARAGMSLGRF